MKVKINFRHLAFIVAFTTSFCLLYTNYYFGVSQGKVLDGGSFRLAVKSLVFLILTVLMITQSKINNYRILIFLFFLYVTLKNVVSFPYISGEVLQIYNPVFFLPLIFTEFKRSELNLIFGLLVYLAIFMLILDFFIPLRAWENGGFSGGIGNPSSFGTFLLIVSIIIRKSVVSGGLLRYLTVLTGAAFPTMLAYMFQFYLSFRSLRHFIFNLLIFSLVLYGIFIMDDSIGFNAIGHIMMKLEALVNGDFSSSASIYYRVKFFYEALEIFTENTFHIIFGSIGSQPVFVGDGFYFGLFATYGLFGAIFFVYVIVSTNFFINSPDYFVNSCRLIIGVYICIFLTNRIIDYWPMTSLFLLAIIHARKAEIADVYE